MSSVTELPSSGAKARGTAAGTAFVRFAWPVALFVLALCYYLLFFDRGVNLEDEGTLFMAADGILHGKVLYRDLYVAYMPGSYYLYALFFKLFGTSVRTGRLLGVLLRCSNAVVVYYLTQKVVPLGFAVLPAVAITLLPGPWHKTLFVTLSLLALWWIARYAEQRSAHRLLLMGLAAGLSWLYRHWLGYVAMAAASAALMFPLLSALRQGRAHALATLRSAGSRVGLFAVAMLLPILVVLFALYRQGALGYMLNVVMFDALRGNLAKEATIPEFRDIFQQWVFRQGRLPRFLSYNAQVLLYYVPVLVYACVAATLLHRQWARKSRREDAILLAVLVFGVGAYGLVLIEPGISHLLVSMPAAWVLGAYLLHRLAERVRPALGQRSHAGAAAYALVLAPVALWFSLAMRHVLYMGRVYGPGTIAQRSANSAWLDVPRAQVFVQDGAEADTLAGVVAWMRARVDAGGYVLVVPSEGDTERLLHFLTETYPPYRQRAALKGISAQQILQLQHDIVAGAEATHTDYVILNVNSQTDENYSHEYLLDYVQSNFELDSTFGRYHMLIRKGQPR